MKNAQRSICPFCSMGCSLLLRRGAMAPYVGAAEIPALDYDLEGRVNRGSLCGKGNMALELLTHPSRLDAPRLRDAQDDLVSASWDTALKDLVSRLRAVIARHGPSSVGLLVGPTLSNEETVLAAALARALGTPHLDQCQPEDHVVLEGLARCGASPRPVTEVEQLEQAQATLIVGDLFTRAPCISKPVLHARYDSRQNVVGTLGFWKSRTYLFGKPVLRCLAGREGAALALLLQQALEQGMGSELPWAEAARALLADIEPAALEGLSGLSTATLKALLENLNKAEHSTVLFGCGFAEAERLDLVAGLSALLAEVTDSRFLAMLDGPNAYGVRRTLTAEGYPLAGGLRSAEMLAATGTGELRALIALSCDPIGSYPGSVFRDAAANLDLLATTAPLDSPTTAAAHVVLPAGTWGEKSGGVLNAFTHEVNLTEVMPPPGTARTDAAILRALLAEWGAAPLGTPEKPQAPTQLSSQANSSEAMAPAFFRELELHLRLEAREDGAREMGTHWMFPESNAAQSGDGWLTRPLSWPAHETPGPVVALSPGHAKALGVSAGDHVRVRSRDAQVRLAVRIEQHLVGDVILVPPHHPETRHLTGWRLDGILRDLDLRPERVTVEVLGEEEQ